MYSHCRKRSFRILHWPLADLIFRHSQFSNSQLNRCIVMSCYVSKRSCPSKEGPLVARWTSCGSVDILWQGGPLVAVWTFCDSVDLLWQCGPFVAVWTSWGSVDLLWQCGPLVAVWTSCGSVDLLWLGGTLGAVWTSCGWVDLLSSVDISANVGVELFPYQ